MRKEGEGRGMSALCLRGQSFAPGEERERVGESPSLAVLGMREKVLGRSQTLVFFLPFLLLSAAASKPRGRRRRSSCTIYRHFPPPPPPRNPPRQMAAIRWWELLKTASSPYPLSTEGKRERGRRSKIHIKKRRGCGFSTPLKVSLFGRSS